MIHLTECERADPDVFGVVLDALRALHAANTDVNHAGEVDWACVVRRSREALALADGETL